MEGHPHPLIYPLGAGLWALGATLILATVPPSARGQGIGLVLFVLPLGAAVLAALAGVLARENRPPRLRAAAQNLVFALPPELRRDLRKGAVND